MTESDKDIKKSDKNIKKSDKKKNPFGLRPKGFES